MTLTEALYALHRAGRIVSPWLPGMRSDPEGWRVVAVELDGDGRLLEVIAYRDGTRAPLLYLGHRRAEMAHVRAEDAATIGCLLVLLREAEPEVEFYVGPSHPWRWMVYRREDPEGLWEETESYADTEGEAVAKALIALAAGCSDAR